MKAEKPSRLIPEYWTSCLKGPSTFGSLLYPFSDRKFSNRKSKFSPTTSVRVLELELSEFKVCGSAEIFSRQTLNPKALRWQNMVSSCKPGSLKSKVPVKHPQDLLMIKQPLPQPSDKTPCATTYNSKTKLYEPFTITQPYLTTSAQVLQWRLGLRRPGRARRLQERNDGLPPDFRPNLKGFL